MKVIELLNKIANGEEVPKKILYEHEGFVFDNECRDYLGNLSNNWLFEDYSISAIVNDEVEVIEEDKKIEKMNEFIHSDSLDYRTCNRMFETLTNKINEIIDKVNKGE